MFSTKYKKKINTYYPYRLVDIPSSPPTSSSAAASNGKKSKAPKWVGVVLGVILGIIGIVSIILAFLLYGRHRVRKATKLANAARPVEENGWISNWMKRTQAQAEKTRQAVSPTTAELSYNDSVTDPSPPEAKNAVPQEADGLVLHELDSKFHSSICRAACELFDN